MRVLGTPGAYARRGFRRALAVSLACGALSVASWRLGHSVGSALLGALSLALLRRALALRRGARGEEEVSRALEVADLPGWAVNGAVLWKRQGDLDHVVLLPWGVFVVETKSGFAGPPAARQARRKAASLETFLARRGVGLRVRPVVVGAAPGRGTGALRPQELVRFLETTRPGALPDAAARRIAAALAARSRGAGGTL